MRRTTVIAFVSGFATALGLAAAPAIAASRAVTPGTATSPQVVIQVPSFVVGATLDATQAFCGGTLLYNFAIPMRITWSASSGSAPVTDFDVYRDTPPEAPGQPVRVVVLANTTRTSYDVAGSNYFNDCGGQDDPPTYEVVAKTRSGGLAPEFADTASVYTSRMTASVWQENGTPEADAGAPLTVTRSTICCSLRTPRSWLKVASLTSCRVDSSIKKS